MVMSKTSKADSAKASEELQSMQQELKSLQVALGELVDALIAEAKPDFSEIKKLQNLKKKALTAGEDATPEGTAKPTKPVKAKRRTKAKKPCRDEPA